MAERNPPNWILTSGVALAIGGAVGYWAGQQQALSQHDLPVRITYRPAIFAHGLVVQLRNFGSRQLALRVVAHSPATNQQHEWRVVLSPDQTQELGEPEGWAFANGDDLELLEDGYRPMQVRVQ